MRSGLTNKLFAGLVVVLIAVVAAQFASSATSTPAKSITARVKALETKVKSLRSQVTILQAKSDCLAAQGITQWGNPAAGQGYIYTNDNGATAVLTTAFDVPAQGQTPTFFAASINPSCVTGSPQHAYRLSKIANHRTVRLERP
jgi:hypothetical protein